MTTRDTTTPEAEIPMKRCSRCQEYKLATEFYANQCYCKPCTKAKHQEWVVANREKANLLARKSYHRHKVKRQARHKEWMQENLERVLAWRQKNRDHLIKSATEWKRNNPERVKAARKAHHARNRDRINAQGRASEKTSMTAVSWDMQISQSITFQQATKPKQTSAQFRPPFVDLSRLHELYTIAVSKGEPPWVPLRAFDDGQRTYLQFREPLTFTVAPAVFATHADGKPGIVEWGTYEVKGEPQKGAYYIVNGLYPVLELRGTDSMSVRIIRQSPQAKPYQEVRR